MHRLNKVKRRKNVENIILTWGRWKLNGAISLGADDDEDPNTINLLSSAN